MRNSKAKSLPFRNDEMAQRRGSRPRDQINVKVKTFNTGHFFPNGLPTMSKYSTCTEVNLANSYKSFKKKVKGG